MPVITRSFNHCWWSSLENQFQCKPTYPFTQLFLIKFLLWRSQHIAEQNHAHLVLCLPVVFITTSPIPSACSDLIRHEDLGFRSQMWHKQMLRPAVSLCNLPGSQFLCQQHENWNCQDGHPSGGKVRGRNGSWRGEGATQDRATLAILFL